MSNFVPFNYRTSHLLIDGLTFNKVSQLLAELITLPTLLQTHINQHQLIIDKANSIQAWLLLKDYLTEQKLDANQWLNNVQFSQSNKPSFFNAPYPIHFNISHSHEVSICAVSHTHPIGVDIEKKTLFDASILNDYFTPNEITYITNSTKPTEHFYSLWTRKEALLKCTGEGVTSVDLTKINVIKNKFLHHHQTFSFYPLTLNIDYIGHVCIQTG